MIFSFANGLTVRIFDELYVDETLKSQNRFKGMKKRMLTRSLQLLDHLDPKPFQYLHL